MDAIGCTRGRAGTLRKFLRDPGGKNLFKVILMFSMSLLYSPDLQVSTKVSAMVPPRFFAIRFINGTP